MNTEDQEVVQEAAETEIAAAEVSAEATAENAEVAPEQAEGEEAPIVIDGQSFKTQKEALEWAASNITNLKTEQAIADAYRQGIADAAGTGIQAPSVTPAAPEEDNFEEEFFKDPKGALQKMKEKAVAEAAELIERKRQVQDADEQIWADFTGAHPDLADFRKDVELIANENREVVSALARTKGQKAAIDFVAQKTRAKFQAYVEKMRPARELAKTQASATPTARPSVTPQKKTDAPLSFAQQVRQNKMSRMK